MTGTKFHVSIQYTGFSELRSVFILLLIRFGMMIILTIRL